MNKIFYGFLIFIWSCATFAASDDRGSKDHPLISRYPNSVISKQLTYDFDSYSISLSSPTKDESSFSKVKKQDIEGKITRTSYSIPSSASLLAVSRSYEQALNQGGFQVLYSCNKEACGSTSYWKSLHLGTAASSDKHQYYIVAKKSNGRNSTYVAIHVTQNGDGGFMYAQVDVAEEKALEKDLIKTSSASLERSIEELGKAVVYDIYFDTGKAELKSESQGAMEAIAQLLKKSPRLTLLVVGHTDGVGTLAANLDLSKRRADAVTAALTTRFGIAKNRLTAHGVGPLAPVATNQDDGGREKNRRVELVRNASL